MFGKDRASCNSTCSLPTGHRPQIQRECVYNLGEGPCASYRFQLIYSFLNLINLPPPSGWVVGRGTFQFRGNCYQTNIVPEGWGGGRLLNARNKETEEKGQEQGSSFKGKGPPVPLLPSSLFNVDQSFHGIRRSSHLMIKLCFHLTALATFLPYMYFS